MYVPTSYQENRREVLLETIRAKSFGSFITQGDSGIAVTHLPFAVDGGDLIGHVARDNPQWSQTTEGSEAVATFMIDDAYIHPGWYPSKTKHGRAVPTWNYIAVEARGTITWLHKAEELRSVLHALTSVHEDRRTEPWALSDAPKHYMDGMLRAIVGFRMTLSSLTGAWKLGQQKKEPDRLGVADGVARERPLSIMPELMRNL